MLFPWARALAAPFAFVVLLSAGSQPPWLRAPHGWVALPPPAAGKSMRILAIWEAPAASETQQNLSLAVESFSGSVGDYASATRGKLFAGPLRPSAFSDVPYRCGSGPARLLVYETRSFGSPRHFEQLLIKRTADVYIGTYTRASTEPQSAAAAASLRAMCG